MPVLYLPQRMQQEQPFPNSSGVDATIRYRGQDLYLTVRANGRQMQVLIPGATAMDQGQLREVLVAQVERTASQLKAKPQLGLAADRYSREDIQGALRELFADRQERRADPGYKRVY